MDLRNRLRVSARLGTAVALGAALSLGTAATAMAAPAHAAVTPASAASQLVAAEAAGSAHASQPVATAANSGYTHACSAVIVVGHQSCFALKRSGVHRGPRRSPPNAIPSGVGYGPSQLQSAYALTSASASNGSGRTVALVDAYDYPNARVRPERLPLGRRPARGRELQEGQPERRDLARCPLRRRPATTGPVEEALDLDMASAICPLCSIVLVEAKDDQRHRPLHRRGHRRQPGRATSPTRWGGSESSSDTSLGQRALQPPRRR